MSSQATIDFEALLAPIAGDNPSGESLRDSPIYDAIMQARREEDPTLNQGDWKRELKIANWREVSKIAIEALSSKSKNLQIAAWLAEALIKQYGFAGARDGLRLLRELQEHFWETLYPPVEDGDLEFRASPLEWINRQLPIVLSEVPLTSSTSGEAYSLFRLLQSRQVEEAGRKSQEEKQRLVAEGKITGEQWDKAVAAGNRAFYEALILDINQSFEQFDKLAAVVDQNFGAQAPNLAAVKQVLEECRSLVEGIVKEKRELEPDAAKPEAPPASIATGTVMPTVAAAGTLDATSAATAPDELPSHGIAAIVNNGSGLISLHPQDRADALRRLEAIAAFFHRTEPHSPVAYLVHRAVRWGQMPLVEWLTDVISDEGVLAHIRETLGIKNSENSG